jgi:hypothetical protein
MGQISQYQVWNRCTFGGHALSRVAEFKNVVGRGGLEPATSAVLGLERSTTEGGTPHETAGVIRLGR